MSSPASSSPRPRDRTLGLAIVAASFVASFAISLWAKRTSEPEQAVTPLPPTSVGVVGFPHAADAVATLPRARELTPRTLLRGFVAEGVKPNGTIDLQGGSAYVRYSFQSPPGKGPQPPRVTGVVPRRSWCGTQNVRLEKQGLYAEPDRAGVACSPVQAEPLPSPRCTLKQIWDLALEKGISPDQPARIEYYRAVAGPAWRFQVSGGGPSFSVYGDCQRELSRKEAAGNVP
jgi:hypothetical protein